MIRRLKNPKRRRGAAAVEFAVVLPVLFILLTGIWEVGRMVEIQQILSNAAREGARQAATGQLKNTDVEQVVLQYLNNAGVPTTNLNITGSSGPTMVSNLTHPAYDASVAVYLDQLQVVVQIPVSDIRWSVLGLVFAPSTQLKSTVTWYTMVDKAYPLPPGPPQG